MAKYAVRGYYEDEQEITFPIKTFNDKREAYDYAYDYEAEHDGIIRTYVKAIKDKSKAKTVNKPVKIVKKPTEKPKLPNGYALMYLADAEDIAMGGDRNRWFTFKFNGQTVTHFNTLDGLMKAIMTQLKPTKKWHVAEVYRCKDGKKYQYGEITITPWDWELNDFRYSNGSRLAKDTSFIAVYKKVDGVRNWDWFAVNSSGRFIPIYYGTDWRRESKPTNDVVKRQNESAPVKKAVKKSQSMSPFDEIDKAFTEGKRDIGYW